MNIDELLTDIRKPGRYIGSEINAIRKEHTPEVSTFAFAFPDLYEIGMSHVGLQILYSIINKIDYALCERVFAPELD